MRRRKVRLRKTFFWHFGIVKWRIWAREWVRLLCRGAQDRSPPRAGRGNIRKPGGFGRPFSRTV